MNRLCLALLSALVFVAAAAGAPPKLVIPAEVQAKPGKWVTITPDTEAKAITYVSLDGLDPFPTAEQVDKRKMIVFPTEERRYRFIAVGSKDDEHTTVEFTIVVGNPPKPGPIIAPPLTPPVTPAPSNVFFFVVVRKDGPADFSFTQTMSLPAWSELTKLGHSYKAYGITEAKKLFTDDAIWTKAVDGATTPFVVTIRESADGKTSSVARKAVPLPSQNDGILDLPKGVK